MALTKATLEKIVALCKRRGFVYQSADIYGGLNGVYDFGPLGVLMKNNIRNSWTIAITATGETILFLEGAILGPQAVWHASGHIENFNDPMIDCTNCKRRFRADELEIEKPCPHCGKLAWTPVRQFNMMFKTNIGAIEGKNSAAYLRPETAQAIFINFKNVLASNRVKIPFGIAQIGKAFRNEITPKQFLFRTREFEQMELEWFCKKNDVEDFFKFWCDERFAYYQDIGIKKNNLRLHEHSKDELAHYSTRCIDIEYNFPFGWKELEGIAHRGNFDLTQHSKESGKDLSVYDEETKTSYIPDVIECSVGVDRLFLSLLFDAYDEDTLGGQERIVLKLNPRIAPIKAAFLPLTKKLSKPMKKIYANAARLGYTIEFDESGSIGKRYRRHDEIGTPVCFTYDFESEQDHFVTARNRDTLQQERVNIDQIDTYLINLITKQW